MSDVGCKTQKAMVSAGWHLIICLHIVAWWKTSVIPINFECNLYDTLQEKSALVNYCSLLNSSLSYLNNVDKWRFTSATTDSHLTYIISKYVSCFSTSQEHFCIISVIILHVTMGLLALWFLLTWTILHINRSVSHLAGQFAWYSMKQSYHSVLENKHILYIILLLSIIRPIRGSAPYIRFK